MFDIKTSNKMKECVLYRKGSGNKVQCLACAHKCFISKNHTGICGVRKNINNKLFLLVYGKIVAQHIDPIEKKPLYHFLPKTKTYSIGTIGCNLGCTFCQNFEISQASKISQPSKTSQTDVENLTKSQKITPKQIVQQALQTGCKSISYTYNEPIILAEFVKDIAKEAKKHNLKNIFVTNGYWTEESFKYLKDYIDAVNIDLKGNDEFYKKYCGAKSARPVKETIERCIKSKIHVEITTLIIPDMNDDFKELEKIAKFLSSIDKKIPWHLSRFFPMFKTLDKSPTPVKVLEKTKEIGEKYLKYVHLGNV